MIDSPVAKGTYLLLIRLLECTKIAVGRLGTFVFPGGWYIYAGSALGPGGLPARLARHKRSSKRMHWHIDYLVAHSTVEASWQIEASARLECVWAEAVRQLSGTQVLVPGFGSSDCRCPAHLVYCPDRPTEQQIMDTLMDSSLLGYCATCNRR